MSQFPRARSSTTGPDIIILSAVFSDAGQGFESLQASSHDMKSVKIFEEKLTEF
jgi:hypothetical protein